MSSFDTMPSVARLHTRQASLAPDPAADFLLPESKAVTYGVTIGSLIFCSLCAIGRIYTRFFVSRKPGWDDLILIVGALSAIVQTVVACKMAHFGLGEHVWEVPLPDLRNYFIWSYVSLGIYPIGNGFIKSALLLQFRRMYDAKSMARKANTFILVLVVIWTIIYAFMGWFPCFPVAKSLDYSIKGHCYALGASTTDFSSFIDSMIAQAVTNVALDLMILGLALHIIWYQGQTRGIKVRTCFVILIGVCVNICAIARAGILIKIVQEHEKDPNLDPTFQTAWGLTVLTLEVNLSVVGASVPVFWRSLNEAVRGRWDTIFVTKEVTVVRSNRYRSFDGFASRLDDERDLTRPRSSRAQSLATDQDSELKGLDGKEQQRGRGAHYEDEFVQSYVNPLRREAQLGGATVASRVKGDKSWCDR